MDLTVADNRRVVLYDDDGSMWAARVWWMLCWLGFDNAALLDGGLQAWRAELRLLETGPDDPVSAAPGSLSIDLRPWLIADKAEVMVATAAPVADGATCLIDALPSRVFRGEFEPYNRPGHIPGAVNVPASSMVDPETGLFRPLDQIRALFPDRPEARVVAY